MTDLQTLKASKPFLISIVALLFDLRFNIGHDSGVKRAEQYYNELEKRIKNA